MSLQDLHEGGLVQHISHIGLIHFSAGLYLAHTLLIVVDVFEEGYLFGRSSLQNPNALEPAKNEFFLVIIEHSVDVYED